MSSPLRHGRPEKDGGNRTPIPTPAASSRGNDGSRARDANTGLGHGPGNLWSFAAATPEPWFSFAPPHPWAPHQQPRAPVFAQPPLDLSPWSTPVTVFPNHPFRAPFELNMPRGTPGEVPFVGFPGGGGGGRAVPMAAVSGCDADGRASCLPLARQVGLRAAAGGSSSNAPRNFIISPLSFHAALALVTAGTRGETQRELLGFLGSASLDELHRAAATALVGRLRRGDLPQASFACGVWVGRNWALTPEFAGTAASRYAAVAESLDFSEPEQARQRVNAFVSEATKGRIADVLPPRSVDASTVLVLANALYFKGAWARPFDPSRTSAAPFHLPGGDTVLAPFMTSMSLFKEQLVAVFPGFKALKLPYMNSGDGARQAAFYMLLLLPDGGEALEIGDLYDKAVSTPGFIREHTPADEVPVGRFMVPKFRFTFEFEASEDMQKLGVAGAFGGGDFSGMVAGGNGLFIAGVYHKATVEVDELGTVAAAATAVGIAQCARAPRPPVDFVADRPFLFAIVEETSGVVLFLGHVVNPLAE